MKIVRFRNNKAVSFGVLEGDVVRIYRGSPFDPSGGPFQPRNGVLPLDQVQLLAPCLPTKMVCLGLNYRHHAAELKQQLPDLPLLFLKPASAVIGPGENIVLPPESQRIDYEGELGVVIGKTARNVPEKDYASYILGYTCFNDVTDRIAQARDGQWTRAKGYDTFAPFGPCIETQISPTNLKM